MVGWIIHLTPGRTCGRRDGSVNIPVAVPFFIGVCYTHNMRIFDPEELRKLKKRSEKPENGEVTIIGGSDLFHGAPILSLTAASRVVDMVYFSSPEPSFSELALQLKSRLSSFIWVPWEEVGDYIQKSDAVLIGPGMKRYREEKLTPHYAKAVHARTARGGVVEYDQDGTLTKFVVEKLLRQFVDKQWVIDGGALQVVDRKLLPKGSIITPNKKEFALLFDIHDTETLDKHAPILLGEALDTTKFEGVIVLKGPKTYVESREELVVVEGGNNGLTKGGTGDTLAGLTVALAAQNDPFLAACSASWVIKKAADELCEKVGTVYNADDLAAKVPEVLGEYLR